MTRVASSKKVQEESGAARKGSNYAAGHREVKKGKDEKVGKYYYKEEMRP